MALSKPFSVRLLAALAYNGEAWVATPPAGVTWVVRDISVQAAAGQPGFFCYWQVDIQTPDPEFPLTDLNVSIAGGMFASDQKFDGWQGRQALRLPDRLIAYNRSTAIMDSSPLAFYISGYELQGP